MIVKSPFNNPFKAARLSLAWIGFLSGAAICSAQTTTDLTNQSTTMQINTAEGLMHQADPLPIVLLLNQAEVLKSQQAWQALLMLLYPQEVHHAGNPAFDSLLGLAASRMGELTRAILAYERVLDAEPQNTVIQAAMASLYFRTGENKDAQFLFQSLQTMPLPSDVTRQLEQYLRALDERLRKPESGFKIWSRCCSRGYTYNFEIYHGARIGETLKDSNFTMVEGVVLDLCKPLARTDM
jgi:tetratricopeptide (TPR) repeat protein